MQSLRESNHITQSLFGKSTSICCYCGVERQTVKSQPVKKEKEICLKTAPRIPGVAPGAGDTRRVIFVAGIMGCVPPQMGK